MRLSQITKEEIEKLSDAELEQIVYGDTSDDGSSADVAILLGASLPTCAERAMTAAKLYLDKRIKYIIPTGGVEWELGGTTVSEARFMERILLDAGVPADAIILENTSTTTKENMVCATFEIVHRLKIENVKSVLVVTSASHLRRSLALAKLFLPRSLKIFGCPAISENDSRENWTATEKMRDKVRREAELIKGLISNGLIDDIEY